MGEENKTSNKTRNIVLAGLAIIVAIQIYFLSINTGPVAPEEKKSATASENNSTASKQDSKSLKEVSVISAFINSKAGTLVVAFSHPIGLGKVGERLAEPIKVSPSLSGTWKWVSPFVLEMTPNNKLSLNTEYAMRITGKGILPEGYSLLNPGDFKDSISAFKVERMDLQAESISGEKAKVRIKGNVSFSQKIDPKNLIKSLQIVDSSAPGKPVEFSINRRWITDEYEFVSEPVEVTAKSRPITVSIDSKLTPYDSKINLPETFAQNIEVSLDQTPLQVQSVDVSTIDTEIDSLKDSLYIRIRFNLPVSTENAAKAISVTPALKVSFSKGGDNSIDIRGDFLPATKYTVKIAKGLLSEDDKVLGKAVEQTLTMPNYEPAAGFASQGMFLSKEGYKTLGLRSVNMPEVKVFIDRVYRSNLFMLFNIYEYEVETDSSWSDSSINSILGDRIAEFKLPTPGPNNKMVSTPLALERHLKDSEPGFYRVMISQGDSSSSGDNPVRWVLLTDIGIIAKKGEKDLFVQTSSIATLKPVAGVKLQAITSQNQILAEGVTDHNGVWHARDLGKALTNKEPVLLVAEKENDLSFLLFRGFAVGTVGLDVAGLKTPASGYMGFIYGERDIYRPGEVVNGLGIVRDSAIGNVPAMPLGLKLKDTQGRIILEQQLKSDAAGLAPFNFRLSPIAMTGFHDVELLSGDTVVATYRFQVEDFVPDRINVNIAPDTEMATPGSGLEYKVASRYLFGPPASGMSVETRVMLSKVNFAPKGYENYVFGDPDKDFEDQELLKEDSNLDDNGEKSFSAKLPEDLSPPSGLEAIVTARVREGGGRGVSAMTRISAMPYTSFPGLRKLESDALTPGKTASIGYVVLSPHGKKIPADVLNVELIKEDYRTVLRRDGESYRYETEKDEKTINSFSLNEKLAEGTIKVTPPGYGSYKLRVTDPASGASSVLSFYAGGGDLAPWAMENPGRIDLVPDKTDYAEGETVTFQARTPFAGKMLVTVERGSILEYQFVEVSGNTAEFKIEAKETYIPNAYVAAQLIRRASDITPGTTARAFGAASFSVGHKNGLMPVTIAAVKNMRPEGKLEVEVSADPDASVTVAAVDEGILQLIAQQTPNPHNAFYTKRSLDVSSYDIFALLFPELNPAGTVSPAGGDEMRRLQQLVRTQGIKGGKPVSFWSGVLTTDASGKVKTSFDIPEFEGAVRLMAVSSKEKRFGSAQSSTLVKSPLTLLPTFPRFLGLGDTVSIPVSVRNDTGAEADFEVAISVDGAATVKEPSQKLAIAQGKEKIVYFSLDVAKVEGKVVLTVTASGAGEKSKSVYELAARSSMPYVTDVSSGQINKKTAELAPALSGDIIPDTGSRELKIGAKHLIRFSGNIKFLLGYPHGCLEQTTSKAFPLLYFADLAKNIAPEEFSKTDTTGMVQRGIMRIRSMQLNGGGFSMWPGGETPHPYASVYTTHFLVEAKQAGFDPGNTLLDNALNYLTSLVKNDETDEKTSLYALFVLAKAGKPDLGAMDYRKANLGAMSQSADLRILLGAAFAAVGQDKVAKELLTTSLSKLEVSSNSEQNFDSALRSKALLTLALVDAAPADSRIPALIGELSSELSKSKASTQENAVALMAMGRFLAQEKQGKSFKGKVMVGDKEVATFSTDTPVSIEKLDPSQPLKIVMEDGYKNSPIYYTVITRAIPTRKSYKSASNVLEIKRELLTRDGKPLNKDNVTQGTLIVQKLTLRNPQGQLDNALVQVLLPTGLEVENPRLSSTEKIDFSSEEEKQITPEYLDLRDDQMVLFFNLEDKEEYTHYSLLRAVAPGEFTLPPVIFESMYHPELNARGDADDVKVIKNTGQ